MKEIKHLNIYYDINTANCIFDKFISSFENNFYSYCNEEELIQLLNNKNVHLLIVKYDSKLLKKIRNLNTQIQIIAVLNELDNSHLFEGLEIRCLKFIQELNCMNSFIDILKDCIKNIDSNKSNIINLGNDFIYDNYNKTLFKSNQIIPLTKKETLFFDLLTKSNNYSLAYEKLNEVLWKGSMTQDSLRSLVKELRKKTYKELIKNISGSGYRLDIKQ